MMYRFIEPEVAGELGKETIMDASAHPPIIQKLNYEFSGWLGDDILESFPCFIVTERLKNEIKSAALTGVRFDDVIVSKSALFNDLYPDKELPKFYWAKMVGKKDVDDFVIAEDFRLLISEKAFEVLSLFNINNASVEDA